MFKKLYFNLPDVTCIKCTESINQTLETQRLISIHFFDADFIRKLLVVEVDEKLDNDRVAAQIVGLLSDIGRNCEYINPEQKKPTANNPEENLGTDSNDQDESVDRIQKENNAKTIRRHLIKGIISLSIGVIMMALMLSGIAIPMLVMYGLIASGILFTVGFGFDSYKRTLNDIKAKNLTMDAFFTLSTLTVVLVSVAHLFFPWLPMAIDSALMIIGFRDLGEGINRSAELKLASGLTFKNRGVKSVKRKRIISADEAIWEAVETHQLNKGDIIRVYRGEVIPIDGICESEETDIYTTITTGSMSPTTIKKGALIYAGMKVPADRDFIEIQVLRPSRTSYLARMDEKIQKASAEKAPIQNITATILKYFIPGVIGTAILSGILIGVLVSPALAIQCAVSVLVSACPCTLGLITPLAIKSGISKGLSHGVQFRSGEALQAADECDHVIFDLNGTLTKGFPVVSGFKVYGNTPKKDFFKILSLLENESEKPIGKAIHAYAKKRTGLDEKINLNRTTSIRGVKAQIDQEEYLVGNIDFLKENNICLPKRPKVRPGEQVTFLVKAGKVLGHIITKDPLRKDAKFVVDELKRMGKTVHICTGADKETALHYAKVLGIKPKHVFAGADNTIETKSKSYYIKHILKGKKCAMIGDGGNDVETITSSHFSIAVKSNASDPEAQANAGALVNNKRLLPVLNAFAISRETVRSIKQNLTFSLGYNTTTILVAGGIFVGLGFALNPAIGAALMVLQMGLILFNQYRVKQQPLAHMKRYEEATKNSANDDLSSPARIKRGLGVDARQAINHNEKLVEKVAAPAAAKISRAHHANVQAVNEPNALVFKPL